MLSQGAVLLGQHYVGTGLTQIQFAVKLALSQSSVSGYLGGRIVPSLRIALKLEKLSKGAIPVAAWQKRASARTWEQHEKLLKAHARSLTKATLEARRDERAA